MISYVALQHGLSAAALIGAFPGLAAVVASFRYGFGCGFSGMSLEDAHWSTAAKRGKMDVLN